MPKDEQKARLRARVKALKVFRLIRGPGGGMADHPDRVTAELWAHTHEDVEQIFSALGASVRPLPLADSQNGFGHILFTERFADGAPDLPGTSPSSDTVVIWDVKLSAFKTPDKLEIWIVDDEESYRVTPAVVESAHAVEPRFAKLADRIVARPARKAGLLARLKGWWKHRTGRGG